MDIQKPPVGDVSCSTSRRVYQLFSSDGTPCGNVDTTGSLPSQWLPPKQRKGWRKTKGTNEDLLVFTTDACVPKHSKWISDWATVSVGSVFWLQSGDRLSITQRDSTNLQQFEDVFRGLPNRFKCAERFLDLSESEQQLVSELPVDDRIRLLQVPVKFHKQFRLPAFGLPQLWKYCDHIAYAKERKHQIEEEKIRLAEEQCRKAQALRLALRDDTFGELDNQDSNNLRIDYETVYEREIRRDDRYSFLAFEVAMASRVINKMLGESVPEKLPVLAADALDAKHQLPVFVEQSGHGKIIRLIRTASHPNERGVIICDRIVRSKIWLYYCWRYWNLVCWCPKNI